MTVRREKFIFRRLQQVFCFAIIASWKNQTPGVFCILLVEHLVFQCQVVVQQNKHVDHHLVHKFCAKLQRQFGKIFSQFCAPPDWQNFVLQKIQITSGVFSFCKFQIEGPNWTLQTSLLDWQQLTKCLIPAAPGPWTTNHFKLCYADRAKAKKDWTNFNKKVHLNTKNSSCNYLWDKCNTLQQRQIFWPTRELRDAKIKWNHSSGMSSLKKENWEPKTYT